MTRIIISLISVSIAAVTVFGIVKFKHLLVRIIGGGILLGVIIGWYSVVVEPSMIVTRYNDFEIGTSGRIVLISDLHLGESKDQRFLSRVVDRINKIQSVDAVVIAGDFMDTDDVLETQEIFDLLNPLADLDYPVYAVLGNHDNQKPGPDNTQALIKALDILGVNLIEGKFVQIEERFSLTGVGDRWAKLDDVSHVNNASSNERLIVVAHNPYSAKLIDKDKAALVLSGHTHCGQVRIPVVYKQHLPDGAEFDKGWYTLDNNATLFITCGVGESILPIRLLNPPVIDVIDLY